MPAMDEKQLGSKITFSRVFKELSKRDFGVLSTITEDKRVHSVGVCYGVSPSRTPFCLYVLAEPRSKKVRNIASNSNVSIVVPLARRIFSFVPPAYIMLQGEAEILRGDDTAATSSFKSRYMLRMLLRWANDQRISYGTETCFIRIKPHPIIITYGLGLSLMSLRRNIGSSGESVVKVVIPPESRERLETTDRLC